MQELEDIRDLHAGPWMVVGDFNLLVNHDDKSNDRVNRRMLSRFRSNLNILELKELYLNGRRYTWSNERTRVTLEKIYHVFGTPSWEELYPTCCLTALGTSVSDHCPILLDINADLYMGRRFKFETFWMRAEGFMEVVQTAWDSVEQHGNPYVVLDRKLQATAKSLKKWSNKWIGNIKLQIAIAMEVIYRLDKAMDSVDGPRKGLEKHLKAQVTWIELPGTIDCKTKISHPIPKGGGCKHSTSPPIGMSSSMEECYILTQEWYGNCYGPRGACTDGGCIL